MPSRIFSLSAIFLLLTGAISWSQDTRGTIKGRILDPANATVPGATVVVTNTAMGTKVSMKSNDEGLYQASFLLPGPYQVEVTAAGFKKSVRGGIQVQVNDRLEVNVQLELGAPEQSVTVTGEAPLLNTESVSTGTLVDAKRVSDLPISYGNPFLLIGLAGGVAFTGDPRLDRPFEPTHIVGYAMGGSRGNLSDVTLDGAPTTATANGNQVIASYVPPTDVVQEFKVQTATFDAQFGQTQGGVTNISIKSGTNRYHGTAGLSSTRPSFWANDFFNNSLGNARPDFTFTRWSGSFGGPVYVPKIFNGKNKTFFMWGYEGLRDGRPRYDSSTTTVPTPDMKNGDFSSLLKVGSSYQIYDPATRVAVAGGRFQETPFANNIIPANRFNPVGKNIMSYYPDPTSPAKADGTENLKQPGLTENAKYRNHTWRVDHQVSDKQRIFVRASLYDRFSTYNDYFHNVATGVTFKFVSKAAVFDDVYTLTPTTVLNVRYSYNRFIRWQDGNAQGVGFDITKLGFPAAYASQISKDQARFPRIDMTGYIGTGFSGENRPVMTHAFASTLTKQRGTHSIRTGMEFRAYQETDQFFSNNQTGQFVFDSTWTRGPLDNAATSPGSLGQSAAALLLGLPSASSLVARAADYAEQSNSWGFFVQDDWKVSRKLTVNLGLRYEFEQPLHERYNKSVLGFDPTYVQPFSATAQANYAKNPTPEVAASSFGARGGLTFAGVDGNPTGLYHTPKNVFMPRVGFAYQVTPNTVLRTGFGMFAGFLGARRGDVIQSGFSQNTNMVPTRDNGLNFIATLSNPFPDGIQSPVGAANRYQTFLGQNITFFNQYPKVPSVLRWQLGVQRQFKGYVFEVNYVGNKTNHIEINRNLNTLPYQYLSTSKVRDDVWNNYLTAALPNPFSGLQPGNTQSIFTGTTIGRSGLLVPYPQFGSVTSTTYDGYSWYHSAQVTIEKRFSKGYTVMANYTLSKFMQSVNLLNAADARPVREISDQDVPHRLSLSGIWELPFGKGKPLANVSNPLASRLISGWQISGILTYQSGFPIAWGNILYYGDPANIALPKGQRSVDHWFNTAGFETATAKQLLGNQVRTWPLRFSQVRAPNPNNVDFALLKNTYLTSGETRREIQFRAEALNAFNHPLLSSGLVTTPTSATFGRISAATQAGYPRRLQLTLKYIF